MKKIGFIGCGKMASAIIKGLIKSKFVSSQNILASKHSKSNIEEKSKELGITITTNNSIVAKNSDIIFLATEPSQIINAIDEIKDFITDDKLIISIAAGVTLKKLEKHFLQNTKIIRVMPNTPALIEECMSGIIGGTYAKKEDIDYIFKLFSTIGKCIIVDNEAQMDIVTAISGSGPAFFYKIINDFAKSGEKLGLDYEKALLLSIQTAIGASKMALNRNISMEELIANVATKGGCTRVGIDEMENLNFDKLFYQVIKNTVEKAHQLGE